jgi:hypothetical protein
MEHLIKINRKRKYVRITIPEEIVKKLDLKRYPLVRVWIDSDDKICVKGVGINGKS